MPQPEINTIRNVVTVKTTTFFNDDADVNIPPFILFKNSE